jgi:hypothetical protein
VEINFNTRTELVLLVAGVILSAGLFHEWRVSHDAITRMNTVIAGAEQERKQTTDELKTKLEAIEHDKNKTVTERQIIERIPQYLTLPEPIQVAPASVEEMVAPPATTAGGGGPKAEGPKAARCHVAPSLPECQVKLDAGLIIPPVDEKPLFDKLASCAECDATVAAQKMQIADLTKERDEAVKTAKGGSVWRRLLHDTKVLGIGAIAGGVLICASGHCK